MNDYLLHYIISLSMVTMSAIIFGLFTFFRRQHHPAALIFSLYCLAIGWWAFWHIFMIVPGDLESSNISSKISKIGVAFIATFFFHFCYKLLNSNELIDWILLKAGYLFSFIILILLPTSYFTEHVIPKVGGKINYLVAGPVYPWYLTYFFFIIIYSMTKLFMVQRSLSNYQKDQMKWVMVGTLAGYIGGGSNFFLSFGIDPYPLVPFGNYGVVLNFICFAYAIFHYRFLDIDEVVEKIRATRLATLGTMAASLNHEIKNPLYIIRGRAEAFLSKWDEGLYQKEDPNKVLAAAVNGFQIVQAQVNRICQITENILGFVRASGSPLQEIHIEESIDRALSVLGYYSKAEGIKIVKKIEPNLPTIKAEAQAIEEIIFNLIANAQQAIKRDGTIQIEAGRKDDVAPNPCQ